MEEHPQNHKSRPGCFFFVVAPFCSCPASLVCCRPPGVQSVFFLLRSGPEQKKTPPRVFFFAPAPRLFGGAGAKKKNTLGGVFFFAAAPRGRSLTHCGPGWRCLPLAGVVFFFLLRPCPDRGGVFFFCCGPGWCFFFCSGPVPASNGASPSLAFRRGRSKKKNTLGGVFFAAAPRGRSVTHCGPGWRCLQVAGAVFFFFAAAPPGPGWCFFFLLWPRPDAHSLTVGWGDFGKARVVFFFLLRPRRVFLDNNKKCLGYYIGSKKTRRGHSKKKNTTSTGSLNPETSTP